MPLSVQDLLQVAQPLCKHPDEPEQRSGVSRAYYAAYHHARAWHAALSASGHNIGPAGGEHQQLINMLKNPDPSIPFAQAKESMRFGAKLEIMRNRRHTADYDLQGLVQAADAVNQFNQASDAVARYV